MRITTEVEMNQFTIINHLEKPILKVEVGTNIFSGERSISIHAYFGEERDLHCIKSSNDESDIEYFEGICTEFNAEFEDDSDWKPIYEEALRDSLSYYQKEIKSYQDKVANIKNKINALEEK